MSKNTLGAITWTDGKRTAPMCPDVPSLVKCPHCAGLVWLERVALANGEDVTQGKGSQKLTPRYEMPTESDLSRLLESSNDFSVEEYKYIRVRLWWYANDIIRSNPTQKTVDYSPTQRENMAALFGMFNASMPNERIAKAEVARELGWFDEAKVLLSSDFQGSLKKVSVKIYSYAQRNNSTVVIL